MKNSLFLYLVLCAEHASFIPANTSSKRPVRIDHTNTSNESSEPAATNSPLASQARHANCVGRGDVNVRKLRYLNKNL